MLKDQCLHTLTGGPLDVWVEGSTVIRYLPSAELSWAIKSVPHQFSALQKRFSNNYSPE